MHSNAHPYGRLAGDLGGSPFSAIRYVAETGSTNADAAKLLGDDRYLGLSIVAEHQTIGTGRKGRSWTAPPGTSLLVTTIVPRVIAASALWAVPFWAARAVRAGLASQGVATAMHWPNDLLIAGRGKIAGILCVSRVTGANAWVACGAGVNVVRPAEGDAAIEPPPAYCDDVTHVDRAQLLFAILRAYEATLDLLADPRATADLWEADAGLAGARYRILKDGAATPFDATALRIADGGGLVVERDDGSIETIDLAHARALRSREILHSARPSSAALRASAQDDT